MKNIFIVLAVLSLLSPQSRGASFSPTEVELPSSFESENICFQIKYLEESLRILKNVLKEREDQYQAKVNQSTVERQFQDNRYNDDGDLKILDPQDNEILIKQKDRWIDHQNQQKNHSKTVRYLEWFFLTSTAILSYYNIKFIREFSREHSQKKAKDLSYKQKSNMFATIKKLMTAYFSKRRDMIKRTSVAFISVASLIFWNIYRNEENNFSQDIDETQNKINYLADLIDSLDSIESYKRIIEDRDVRLEILLDEISDTDMTCNNIPSLLGTTGTQE